MLSVSTPRATRLLLVDSHCHINFDAYAKDREAIMDRARAQGIRRMVNPGTTLEDSQEAVNLAQQYTDVYAAVGVHPHAAATRQPTYLEQIRDLARQPKVVALGEIGLDYYRDLAPRRQQAIVFREQLDLAAVLGLPVIIHCRDAQPDVLRILSEWTASREFRHSPLTRRPFAGVLHAFSGDLADARQAYAQEFLLGLGGPVTFRNARALHQLVPVLDLNRLMLETDSPFLSPHPHRGQRNEPSRLPLICRALADRAGTTPARVATITTATAARFFGWTDQEVNL